MTSSKKSCFVYWLHNDRCVCPWRHGYVGITDRPTRRRWDHRISERFPLDFQWTVLFQGTRIQCLRLEFKLRPIPDIGWNKANGGAAGACPRSEETRARIKRRALERYENEHQRAILTEQIRVAMEDPEVRARHRASLLGHSTSEETKRKIAASLTGHIRTETSKAKQSASTKGKPKSAEWKTMMSRRAKERYIDPAERAKTSAAVKAGLAAKRELT